MSRIGKKPITIPAGVDVKVDGSKVTVKGPKGTLENTFNSEINIALEGNEIIVTRPTDDKNHRALHGLTRTLIHNMVEGVTNGYSKTLEVNGVGYRAQKQGKNLVLNLGYSHQVIVPEVPGITIEVPSANSVVISGADKQQVGQFAAEVREKRPPEPYKGKGIKYADEHNKNFPLHPAKCSKQKSLRLSLLAHLDQRKDEGIHCNHALHHCNFYFRVTTLLCRLNADRSPAAPHRTVPDCAPH